MNGAPGGSAGPPGGEYHAAVRYGAFFADRPDLLDLVLRRSTARLGSIHGVEHWARVERNGLWLAPRTGARVRVVRLFALLHDCRRLNDAHDPGHGPRAAELAADLGAERLGLDPVELELLCRACEGHTRERLSDDPTIGTCWDADRLDLPRVGITPDPRFFSTEAAREIVRLGRLELVEEAGGRAVHPGNRRSFP